MLSSLHDLISLLEHGNQLQRIAVPVATELEIAAITRTVSGYLRGGSALLFQQPDRFTLPVATNLYGSRQRMRTALGVDRLYDLTGSFKAILQSADLRMVDDLAPLLAKHSDLSCCAPTTVADGPCHELRVAGDDLLQLPFLQNWPDDGRAAGTGRYITLGQVVTADPDGGSPNCGIYRCQIHDAHSLAIRWRHGSGAERHHRLYRERGARMPVAVVLGGPPALTLTSAWPLPNGVDEVTFAGWLRNAPIPQVACSHGPLAVPAEAELVIEGFAEPDAPLLEGPFGNHTGLYDPAGPAARISVTRITHRRNAVLPATVVGPPPQEDYWMMLGWERLLAALLPKLVPGVCDIRLPLPWVFRQSAVISLENHSPGMVRETVEMLWKLPWFRKARLLVLVDAATPPADLLKTAWRVVSEVDWLDDLIRDEAGGRLAVDATGRRAPGESLADDVTDRLIQKRWKEYGLS